MLLSLGVSDGGGIADRIEAAAEKYKLDLTASGFQPMSDERVTVEVLAETARDWLNGTTVFAYSDIKKTYNEFVEHIGCEPSLYQYRSLLNRRVFVWHASDNPTAWFCAEFEEWDGKWSLRATGSANLGFVM